MCCTYNISKIHDLVDRFLTTADSNRELTFYKYYYVNKDGTVSSACQNTEYTVADMVTIKSDRTSQVVTTEEQDYGIDHGIHVFLSLTSARNDPVHNCVCVPVKAQLGDLISCDHDTAAFHKVRITPEAMKQFAVDINIALQFYHHVNVRLDEKGNVIKTAKKPPTVIKPLRDAHGKFMKKSAKKKTSKKVMVRKTKKK
jgi:hypothetical protein